MSGDFRQILLIGVMFSLSSMISSLRVWNEKLYMKNYFIQWVHLDDNFVDTRVTVNENIYVYWLNPCLVMDFNFPDCILIMFISYVMQYAICNNPQMWDIHGTKVYIKESIQNVTMRYIKCSDVVLYNAKPWEFNRCATWILLWSHDFWSITECFPRASTIKFFFNNTMPIKYYCLSLWT